MEGRREGGREGASFFPNQELTPKNLKIESFKAVSLKEKVSERKRGKERGWEGVKEGGNERVFFPTRS